jgi:hypothetical protein
MSDTALSVAQMLWEERIALMRTTPSVGTARRPDSISQIYRQLNEDNNWALCLSGGGIRSAAFSLGIVQRFADQSITPKRDTDEKGSVLQQFEYLSTVSGGGYIGSWLCAWLFQERQRCATAGAETGGANSVVAALTGRMESYAEFGPISNLRRDSHYLAPSFSAISPDVWSGIVGVARNLILNWILFVPPVVLAVLMTKAVAYGFIDALYIHEQTAGLKLVMIAATLCLIVALSFSAANRPGRGLTNASQNEFLKYDLAIFLLGSALLIFVLGSPNGQETLVEVADLVGSSWETNLESKFPIIMVLFRGTLLGAAIYLLSWLISPLWKRILSEPPQPRLESKAWHAWVDLGAWFVSGATFGALIAIGYLLVIGFAPPDPDHMLQMAGLVGVCGPPWILLARVIASVVFVAFAEFVPGADASLEYQARFGGIFILVSFVWLIWFSLVLLAPVLTSQWKWKSLSALFATGTISGAFSVIVGFTSKTEALIQQGAGLRRYLTLNTLATAAAAIFAAVLVVLLSIAIERTFTFAPLQSGAHHPSWTLVTAVGGGLLVLVSAASVIISINRYSLHSIYRNRLVRAFLGASRNEEERERSKNCFTDFDSRDSPLLHECWAGGNPRGDNWKPLHVINAALNLVSSKNLAWQERMAAPFTFSALHCGSGSSIFHEGAYRATKPSSTEGRPYGARLGMTLGTVMAISGAAVSPNMGYCSSPGVAFLMALFNVRLGWWLANPRGDNPDYWRVKPRMSLLPYFWEMFGLTSEVRRWVYLSDGGHFENLGLYEMVRRRCRVIVVIDAGCDSDYTFNDLGNALRKIWIDLGVSIDFQGLDRLKKRFKERPTPATQAPYWAIGRIRYDVADAGATEGLLLYIKSGLHGTEPMDVLSYAMTHPTFPHETTANQFFTESQFESYRMLGYEIASRALESGGCLPRTSATLQGTSDGGAATASLTLDFVIKKLETQLAPSSI